MTQGLKRQYNKQGSRAGKIMALHTADLSLSPSTLYGPEPCPG